MSENVKGENGYKLPACIADFKNKISDFIDKEKNSLMQQLKGELADSMLSSYILSEWWKMPQEKILPVHIRMINYIPGIKKFNVSDKLRCKMFDRLANEHKSLKNLNFIGLSKDNFVDAVCNLISKGAKDFYVLGKRHLSSEDCLKCFEAIPAADKAAVKSFDILLDFVSYGLKNEELADAFGSLDPDCFTCENLRKLFATKALNDAGLIKCLNYIIIADKLSFDMLMTFVPYGLKNEELFKAFR